MKEVTKKMSEDNHTVYSILRSLGVFSGPEVNDKLNIVVFPKDKALERHNNLADKERIFSSVEPMENGLPPFKKGTDTSGTLIHFLGDLSRLVPIMKVENVMEAFRKWKQWIETGDMDFRGMGAVNFVPLYCIFYFLESPQEVMDAAVENSVPLDSDPTYVEKEKQSAKKFFKIVDAIVQGEPLPPQI
jgi:hypothetical protein